MNTNFDIIKAMNKFIDNLTLLIMAVIIYGLTFGFGSGVVPTLTMIILVLSITLIDKDFFTIICLTTYGFTCYFLPDWVIFIPLLTYGLNKKIFCLISAAFFPVLILHYSVVASLSILALMLLSLWLRFKTDKYAFIGSKFHEYQDSSFQQNSILYHQNKELINAQAVNSKLAALEERNRIAREIHDNIGHVLSGSILQTGALIATSKDEESKKNLIALKDNLYAGMQSIRNSIHNIHEDFIDLDKSVALIAEQFTFCKAELRCDTQSIAKSGIASSIIAVVKESLSNVIKHSNATKVYIDITELPRLYKLNISDNGTIAPKIREGLGLRSIRERAQSYDGYMRYEFDGGFKLTATFIKKDRSN